MSKRWLQHAIRASVCLAVAAVLLFPHPAAAELTYDLLLGAGFESSDNAGLAPDEPDGGEPAEGATTDGEPAGDETGRVETTDYTFHAGVNLDWKLPEDSFGLVYLGTYRDVGQEINELESGWVHKLQADIGWRRWSPFFLEAYGERNRVSQYSGGREADVNRLVDRNRLLVRPGFTWDLGPTRSLETAARWEHQDFPDVEDADRRNAVLGELSVGQRWDPRTQGELRIAYGRIEQALALDHDKLEVTGEVSRQVTPDLAITGSLSWHHESDVETAEETGDGTGAEAGEATEPPPEEEPAETERDFLLKKVTLSGGRAKPWRWSIGYHDRSETLQDGDVVLAGRTEGRLEYHARLGSRLHARAWYEDREFRASERHDSAWGSTLKARWLLAGSLALDLRGEWGRTERSFVDRDPQASETLELGAAAVYVFWRRFQLEAGYEHLRNDDTLPEDTYRRDLWYLLLSVALRPLARGVVPEGLYDRLGSPLL